MELGPYPVEDGEGVPGVGISKREDPERLTEPGPLEFQKPKSGREGGVEMGMKDVSVKYTHTYAN